MRPCTALAPVLVIEVTNAREVVRQRIGRLAVRIGVDRLVMLATGAEKIEDVLWLPVR